MKPCNVFIFSTLSYEKKQNTICITFQLKLSVLMEILNFFSKCNFYSRLLVNVIFKRKEFSFLLTYFAQINACRKSSFLFIFLELFSFSFFGHCIYCFIIPLAGIIFHSIQIGSWAIYFNLVFVPDSEFLWTGIILIWDR